MSDVMEAVERVRERIAALDPQMRAVLIEELLLTFDEDQVRAIIRRVGAALFKEEAYLRRIRFHPMPNSSVSAHDLFTGNLHLDHVEWKAAPPGNRLLDPKSRSLQYNLAGRLVFILAREEHPEADTYRAEVSMSEMVKFGDGRKMFAPVEGAGLDLRIRHDGGGAFSFKVIGAGENSLRAILPRRGLYALQNLPLVHGRRPRSS